MSVSKKHHFISLAFMKRYFKGSKIIYNKKNKPKNLENSMCSNKLYTIPKEELEKNKLGELPEDFLEKAWSQAETKVFGNGNVSLYEMLKEQIYNKKEIDKHLLNKFVYFMLFLYYKHPSELKKMYLLKTLDNRSKSKDTNNFEEDISKVIKTNPKNFGSYAFTAFSLFGKIDGEVKNILNIISNCRISILKTKNSFILPDNLISFVNYKDNEKFHGTQSLGWFQSKSLIFVPFDKNTYILFEIIPKPKNEYNKSYKKRMLQMVHLDRQKDEFDWNKLLFNQSYKIYIYNLDSKSTSTLNSIFALQSNEYLKDFF